VDVDLAIDTSSESAVKAAGASDVGHVRRRNEDAFLLRPDLGLFLVADGVSGRADGHLASRMAVEEVAQFVDRERAGWPRGPRGGVVDSDAALLAEAVHQANDRVFRAAKERSDERGMTTTFVGALCSADKVCVAHVGDSRAYRLRGLRLEQLTEDHSVGNEVGSSAQADAWLFAGVSPRALTRGLGLFETTTPTVGVYRPETGDVLLLCSDGLTNMLLEEEIAALLGRRRDVPILAHDLVAEANRAGGVDNTTVVVVRW
jgi:protein phosphatase